MTCSFYQKRNYSFKIKKDSSQQLHTMMLAGAYEGKTTLN